MNVRDRIMGRVAVDAESGCWVYAGSPSARYPQIRVDGRLVKVHRVMYEIDRGPIPDGLTIDHVREHGCTSTRCCNPAHLEAVTRGENVLRGDAPPARFARSTHCKHGHPFDAANTYLRPKGGRDCRACLRRRSSEWRAGR